VSKDTSIDPSIADALQLGSGRRRRHWVRWAAATALLVVVAIGGYLWLSGGGEERVTYVTSEVTKGNLTVTVTATGNLKAINQVDVGSEISGIIKTVHVDVNQTVKAGQPLARLDPDKLEAQVLLTRAALAAAKARVAEAEATVSERKGQLERIKSLAKQKWRSDQDLDIAQAAYLRAVAALAVVKALVQEAMARLRTDETNLRKAIIRAPVDGVVLERKVEPGQTVAASFQAPVLFVLAEDLRKMELRVDVDEADVGKVKTGLAAVFTVDAYPQRRFRARITRVNYASKVNQGVVSYETLLQVDNSDLSLRPGMTATAEITAQTYTGVTTVPNAALRFTPQSGTAATRRGGVLGALVPRRPRTGQQKPKQVTRTGTNRTVYILVDGSPKAVSVTIGATDGKRTIIRGGEISPGVRVIVEARRGR
jgi:HlyD family secretion protein